MIPSLSSLHLSSIQHSEVDELLFSWEEIMTRDGGEEYIQGENDLFHVEKRESRWNQGQELPKSLAMGQPDGATDEKIIDFNSVLKKIVPHDESWPGPKLTPSFNHGLFYSSLKGYRQLDEKATEWGSVLMYGEVVTSTNTLLDKWVFTCHGAESDGLITLQKPKAPLKTANRFYSRSHDASGRSRTRV